MKILPVLAKDFYKTGHINQYPKNTQFIYSNITPRGSRIAGIDKVVVFGIQGMCKDFLIEQYNEHFFYQPKYKVVEHYKRRMDTALGKDMAPWKHIAELHDLGYLPIQIKALKEGSLCPLRVPFMTIKNTHPDFFWLTNDLEAVICDEIWHPMTSATIAHEYRKMLDKYCKETSDMESFVDWQGHDFSMRGMSGLQAAIVSGAAHLLSFKGTDTILAIDYLEQYYKANAEKELIGGSVPATEHSVMCMGGSESEFDTYKRLISEVYPSGIVSIVSDTWDYWSVLTKTIPSLKKEILSREGKLVIRPDSGDPVKIICGDRDSDNPTVRKGSVELLWDTFGGTINEKGFKQLDSHIGVIYGDSITLERCNAICEGLKRKGFASTNVVFGIGSYTYQYVTRDTFGFAMKATWGVVDGEEMNIFKDPKTDNGLKKSAKGLLRVNKDMSLSEEVSVEEETGGELKTVFLNGQMINEYSLEQIRERLKNNSAE